MDPASSNGIEIGRQCGNEGFSFPSFHFGDLSGVQNDAAEHLDIKVAHPQDSFSGFTNDGKSFGEEVAEEIAHLGVGARFL